MRYFSEEMYVKSTDDEGDGDNSVSVVSCHILHLFFFTLL